MPAAPYPLVALRALALHAQGLATPNGAEPVPSLETIFQTVDLLGAVQIDTLQMVARSQYLTLWSRLGRYAPADFDRLIFDPAQRRLFEGWQHCACILPLHEYRYQMPHQRSLRDRPTNWYTRWLADTHNAEMLPKVRERVEVEGALRAADFEYHGPRRGSWWDWKPAKVALEYLYAFGDLMIADRVNFQRVYDLTERVLPAWVDRREPDAAERDRYWIERGVKALGVCTPAQAADYTYRKQAEARPIVRALRAEGVLAEITGQLADGTSQTLLVHRDHLPLLQAIADGACPARRVTFLNPFDNLFWAKRRDEQLWGFRQSLEAYKPAPQRIWGYFCLPILYHDRLVGRFDPKLERQNRLLRLKALYLEESVEPDDELVQGVARAMVDFMAFHNADQLVIERSQPAAFGEKLLRAVSAA